MPDWMPSWGTTALIAIATSLLTLIVSGRYVSPLLEVRNRRFQAKMQARERFQADMLTVMSAATRLLAAPIPTDATESVRSALRGERQRWQDQIDEATKRLADRFEEVAFSYAQSRTLTTVAVRYSGNVRMVWISDRSEERKLTALRDTTQRCHTLLFDSPVLLLQRARAGRDLDRLLDELEAQPEP
ncbi:MULTISPECIES: hypothetical protein [Streptomyces]|uniref:hypothetical protein n=1 Tax=Streptomyces TaxID=1883 RepID=UPI000B50D12D|nr:MULTISPECIES: hypothetical protein [unclassified Streptomyces]MYW99900.1 hypothetical protein [Streptomyces sp. SID8378]SNB89864.1 hypothetical protein SAMN02745831_06158 [Streptomyces sp. PgraA7]